MNLVNKLYYFLKIRSKNSQATEPKLIDFYHIVIVFKGSFTYVINNEIMTVEENDILLLPPNTVRQKLPYTQIADFAIFNFHITKDKEFFTPMLLKNSVTPLIKNLVNSIPYNFYNDASTPYDFYKLPNINNNPIELSKIKGLLHNILNCILIELFDSLNYSTKKPYIVSILNYINDNITSPITLTDICKTVPLSKEYVTRIFKKEMGITVTEYINQQKLTLAKNMLASEELSLQNICDSVGYQNYHYFSRLFKKHFGISPIKMKLELKKEQKTSP